MVVFMSLYRESKMSVDLQSPSFLVHIPLMSFFLPGITTVLVTSKKSWWEGGNDYNGGGCLMLNARRKTDIFPL